MSKSPDLTARDSHFAFGKNWARYADVVGEPQIEQAIAGLQRLVGDRLAGGTFLDIGCGSGVHALAALRLGAAQVVAVDIDADSVATSRRLLGRHAPGAPWRVVEGSVFDLTPEATGRFDIVYSWGVLHHTGDMYRALRCAAGLVKDDGVFAFALYRQTACCGLWKIEKKWYAQAGNRAQHLARRAYIGASWLNAVCRGRSLRSSIKSYVTSRGMDFDRDVHDWLGGWPYESISPVQTERFMTELGLRQVRAFLYPRRSLGLFGSGCDEYVYARN